MKIKEYVDYWEKAARSNKRIAHNPENNVNRFRRMNVDEILTDQNTDLKEKTMILENPEFRLFDALSDNPRKMITGGLLVIAEYEKGNFDDEIEKLAEMEIVAEQMLAKVRNDAKKYNINPKYPFKIKGIDLNSIRVNKVSNLFGYWTGWRIEFTFNQTFDNQLILKNEDWTDDTAFAI